MNVNQIHRLHYVWFQNNPSHVLSNAQITQLRIYGEPYAHKFSAIDHPSSSNITHCQVLSHARVWFNDSAGDIDFYQMFLSQSESTILHKRIILNNDILAIDSKYVFQVLMIEP